MVDAALRAAGIGRARYTSPHLQRLEERFVIDGARSGAGRARGRRRARPRRPSSACVASGGLAALPTFFECTTAVAFDLFREARVDVAVLEVGLGGRLDATNIVSPIAAAIVSIDFDHEAQLGDTLAAIAAEKAGIIKPGVPVVCGPLPAEAMEVIATGARRNAARRSSATERRRGAWRRGSRRCRSRSPARTSAPTPPSRCALLETIDADARHRIRVAAAARRGRPDDGGVAGPARDVRRWRGRRVLLDAAHNPAGARALASYLASAAPGRRRRWSSARCSDKAVARDAARARAAACVGSCARRRRRRARCGSGGAGGRSRRSPA